MPDTFSLNCVWWVSFFSLASFFFNMHGGAYLGELPGVSTRLVSSRTPFVYVPDSTERLTAPTTREL